MDEPQQRVIDELLVVRCQEGRRAAFDLLIRRWQRRLWRYARRLTGSDDTAWDVTQETWAAVLSRIRSLRDPAWFPVWVYRIVRNKCADHCRRASRRRHLVDALANRQQGGEPRTSDGGADEVAEAMRRLPPDRQEILMLKYGSDLNVVEIAVVLEIPAGTVKSRLHNAREELRRMLERDKA